MFVVVQINGGSVWVDDEGVGGSGVARTTPSRLQQVREGRYALRECVEQVARWRGSPGRRSRRRSDLVLPFTEVVHHFSTPEGWPAAGDNSHGDAATRTTMAGMTFEDLPKNANEIPLTDPVVAGDVIDLVIGEADRAAGCLALMVCDSGHRGVQPILVGDVPDDADPGGLVNLLRAVAPLLQESGGSVLIGRGRAHGSRATDADREWHEAAIRTCRDAGMQLLGFYVATAEGVFRLPDPLQAAS